MHQHGTNEGFLANDPANVQMRGAVFRIERRTPEFLAQWVSPVAIIPCEGARDETSEAALAEAFKKGGWKRVAPVARHSFLVNAAMLGRPRFFNIRSMPSRTRSWAGHIEIERRRRILTLARAGAISPL
jgi:hypothetical protein